MCLIHQISRSGPVTSLLTHSGSFENVSSQKSLVSSCLQGRHMPLSSRKTPYIVLPWLVWQHRMYYALYLEGYFFISLSFILFSFTGFRCFLCLLCHYYSFVQFWLLDLMTYWQHLQGFTTNESSALSKAGCTSTLLFTQILNHSWWPKSLASKLSINRSPHWPSRKTNSNGTCHRTK